MLRWALIFLIISLVAGVFGFAGIAASAGVLARAIFFAALALFVIFLTVGIALEKKLAPKL